MHAFLTTFTALALLAVAFPSQAQAQCPVCTVAVAAGVGMSRYLGIDDTVSGVWMGALTIITALWMVKWLESRKIRFMFRRPLIVIATFLLTVWPLYGMKLVGNPLNMLWGVDKLLLGMTAGTVVYIVAAFLDELARILNNQKVFVPFQRVIIPVVLLAFSSLVFYLLTK